MAIKRLMQKNSQTCIRGFFVSDNFQRILENLGVLPELPPLKKAMLKKQKMAKSKRKPKKERKKREESQQQKARTLNNLQRMQD